MLREVPTVFVLRSKVTQFQSTAHTLKSSAKTFLPADTVAHGIAVDLRVLLPQVRQKAAIALQHCRRRQAG